MEEKQSNGMAIAGMVLGILSIPASCCIALLGVIVGIVGLVLSIMAQKKAKSGMGLAGIITASIGIAFGVLNMVAGAALMAYFGGAEGFMNAMQ